MRSNNALAAMFVRNAWHVVVPKDQTVVQALAAAGVGVMTRATRASAAPA